MTRSVLQDWVMELPLRHQGTLLAGTRGCDGALKNDPAKYLLRFLRYCWMNPADEREVSQPNAFFARDVTDAQIKAFNTDLDQYPVHFVMHLLYMAEVVAYCSPDVYDAERAMKIYRDTVRKLHLRPETREEFEHRLTCDRMATGRLIEPSDPEFKA